MSTNDAGTPKTRKRTAAEIEADLDRTRALLTETVDELSERLDPRKQVQDLKDQAKAMTEGATKQAKTFVDDVKSGDSKALSIVGGAAAAIAAIVGISVLRRKS